MTLDKDTIKQKKDCIYLFLFRIPETFYPRGGYRKPALSMSSKWATIFADQGGYSGRV